jgi:hypothetical protein
MKAKAKPQAGAHDTARHREARRLGVGVFLSRLAYEALLAETRIGSVSVSTKLEGAIRYYLGDRDCGRATWAYPAFLRGNQAPGEIELELSIDAESWHSFEIEVGRQDVSLRQLLDHAAFYFVAGLDSGRVAQRILDDLESANASAER